MTSTKTPEQMAEEWANSTDSFDVDQEYVFAYKGFLAGYHTGYNIAYELGFEEALKAQKTLTYIQAEIKKNNEKT